MNPFEFVALPNMNTGFDRHNPIAPKIVIEGMRGLFYGEIILHPFAYQVLI